MKNNEAAATYDHSFFPTLAEYLVSTQMPFLRGMQSLSSAKSITRRELTRRVLAGQAFIDECFREEISLEKMAQQATLSPYHFLRVFRAVHGITPHRYLLNKRLSYASDLLSHSTDSISAIAFRSGFEDLSSFSRAFKKMYGRSPLDYRKEVFGSPGPGCPDLRG